MSENEISRRRRSAEESEVDKALREARESVFGTTEQRDKAREEKNRAEREEEERQRRVKRRTVILLLLLLLLLLTSCGGILYSLLNREILAPDYAPQDVEWRAEDMEEGAGAKLPQPEGGGASSLIYTTQVVIDASLEEAQLFMGNPGKSNQDIVLQLVVKDTLIIQSGTIKPGKKVETMDLLDGAASRLRPGGYDGLYIVSFYNNTGEKAMLDSEIPVTVNVIA